MAIRKRLMCSTSPSRPLPIAHELLRGLPTPQIQRSAHQSTVQFPLDRERAIAMAVLAPLRGELTTTEMPSENREHERSMARLPHAVHTHVSRSSQTADFIVVSMVPGGGVEPPWPQGPADFESPKNTVSL